MGGINIWEPVCRFNETKMKTKLNHDLRFYSNTTGAVKKRAKNTTYTINMNKYNNQWVEIRNESLSLKDHDK